MLRLRTAAIIPAAGFSSRMQDHKPLLKIGSQTMVERTIGLCKQAGVDDIIVVLGHRAEQMIPVVAKTNARWQLNPDYSAGMFSSIRCGIRAIPASCAAFFLLPVDIPLVAPATLMHLRDVFQRSPAVRICYPSYRGRRGHPPLIDRQLVQELLDYEGTEGMRGFLRNYEDQSLVIPVADRFIAMDADTPHDFQQLQEACRPEE